MGMNNLERVKHHRFPKMLSAAQYHADCKNFPESYFRVCERYQEPYRVLRWAAI